MTVNFSYTAVFSVKESRILDCQFDPLKHKPTKGKKLYRPLGILIVKLMLMEKGLFYILQFAISEVERK